MKQKTNLKCRLLTVAFCIAAFIGGIGIVPQTAITVQAQANPEVQPLADIKEWIYRIEDGKLYKRLYNGTKGRWEGDWIYVCDWIWDMPDL